MNFDKSLKDEQLMQAYQNGSEAAFKYLFERHSPRVYGFLMNRLRNRSQTDDVFQAVFLKLHQSRRLYDPTFLFTPWLFTICKSVLIDQLRKSQRNKEDTNDEVLENTAAKAESSSTMQTDLSAYLRTLPANQKDAIELRYAYDLPFEEIALRLETSPSNVRKLISRGVKKLKVIARKGGL